MHQSIAVEPEYATNGADHGTPATPDSCDPAKLNRPARVLWVDLTREAQPSLVERLNGGFVMALHRIKEPTQVSTVIEIFAPQLVCFEFDQPEVPGISALARTRREHPSLPVLLITGCLSEAVARWALQTRVWDLLIKPIPVETLFRHIAAVMALTSPPQDSPSAIQSRRDRTLPAVSLVAAQFHRKIALEKVADLCRLSLSQFCRVFKQEHGTSFSQYLLHYRIQQACDRLSCPGAVTKEVAYSVGFNDLSYFSRAFKRQVGVCPTSYRPHASEL